jgi:hypothetical protein
MGIRQALRQLRSISLMIARVNSPFSVSTIALQYAFLNNGNQMFKAFGTIALLFMAAPGLASAEDLGEAQQASAPERISFLVTFGDDECPEAIGDEIVVCAPAPEGDRYRIPRDLREDEPEAVSGGASWTSAVETLDEYARANLPNSCSVNGSNGFTGCTQKMLQQWFAERRGRSDAD